MNQDSVRKSENQDSRRDGMTNDQARMTSQEVRNPNDKEQDLNIRPSALESWHLSFGHSRLVLQRLPEILFQNSGR